jgi:hypothetical protein
LVLFALVTSFLSLNLTFRVTLVLDASVLVTLVLVTLVLVTLVLDASELVTLLLVTLAFETFGAIAHSGGRLIFERRFNHFSSDSFRTS